MFEWFKKNQNININPLTIDVHSHLIPGIDDGVKTYDESVSIILKFKQLGYKKIITTPHIMSDAYRNTPEIILPKLNELNRILREKNIDVVVEAAAEYYLDENFIKLVEIDQVLTFGKKYLLFETNFLTEPFNLKEFIFLATTRGYKPVLAHPERYFYLQNKTDQQQDLLDRGVLFQVNISSITGHYSKQVKQTAQKLIEMGWVHFLGTDCHHEQHIRLTETAQDLKYFKKALSLPLLNNTL